MPFSEDELRSALRRKEPSADFTQKVMARLGEQPAQRGQRAQEPGGFFLLRWPWMVRWGMAGALAVLVLAAGLRQYQLHQEQARAEQARQQTILALQITAQKMDHVFHRASRTPAQNPANIKEQL